MPLDTSTSIQKIAATVFACKLLRGLLVVSFMHVLIVNYRFVLVYACIEARICTAIDVRKNSKIFMG